MAEEKLFIEASEEDVPSIIAYCLSCNFVIILKNIKSITAQNLCHMSCKLLGKLHGFSCNFLIDIIDICIVLFRKNQRVSF